MYKEISRIFLIVDTFHDTKILLVPCFFFSYFLFFLSAKLQKILHVEKVCVRNGVFNIEIDWRKWGEGVANIFVPKSEFRSTAAPRHSSFIQIKTLSAFQFELDGFIEPYGRG